MKRGSPTKNQRNQVIFLAERDELGDEAECVLYECICALCNEAMLFREAIKGIEFIKEHSGHDTAINVVGHVNSQVN